MKIQLTQGKVAQIDDEDEKKVLAHKWIYVRCNKKSYREIGYAATSILEEGKRKRLYLHHLILPREDGKVTDHISGDSLDNRKENLRLCTRRQNQQNHHSHGGLSRYKGVTKDRKRTNWEARIKVNGKKIHLGMFKDEIFAASAYNEAALKYHGEFARLNT